MDLKESMYESFPSSERIGDNSYSATFIAVVISDSHLFSTWIGSQQAKLFRGGRCVNATTPHVTFLPGLGDNFAVTNKTLSTAPDQVGEHVDYAGPWSLVAGDVIVMADSRLFALGTDDEVATIVSTAPESAAKYLVDWAEERQHQFAQSSVVIRCRGNSIGKEMEGRSEKRKEKGAEEKRTA
jgi:hypothetical protein